MAQPRPLPVPEHPGTRRPRGRLLRLPRKLSWRGWRAPGRRTKIALIAVATLIALIVVASFFVDEPLRRTIESQMNARMEGYTVGIEKLSFHPLGFGVTLYGLTFAQDAYPNPPVLDVKQLDASVEWKSLLRGKLVANFGIENPKLHVHLAHLREEAKDSKPVTDKGWQDAFKAIYPLEINSVVIHNGEATYVDPGPFKPLKITNIEVRAENIRNVHSRERDYPSSLRLDAVVFESGKLTIDGHADFLAEPHLGVKANVGLAEIPLDYFKPITDRYNVSVSGGILTAEGLI